MSKDSVSESTWQSITTGKTFVGSKSPAGKKSTRVYQFIIWQSITILDQVLEANHQLERSQHASTNLPCAIYNKKN